MLTAELAQGSALAQAAARVIPAPALLAAMCDMQNFRFLVDGTPAPAVAVLSEDLLFPAVAWVANEQGRDLMRADLGYRFEADPRSTMGVRVSGPPVRAHTADLYRALFLMDACTTLFGVRPNGAVEITTVGPQLRDHLFSSFLETSSPLAQPRQESATGSVVPETVS